MIDNNWSKGPQSGPAPQGRLVLPAPPSLDVGLEADGRTVASPPVRKQVAPEMLIRRTAEPAPGNYSQRVKLLWQKDPAYKVLLIAVVLVIVVGIVFASVMGSVLTQNGSLFGSQNVQVPLTPPRGANPTGTVDLRPTFTVPSGKGSGTSSQPAMQPTPALQVTPTPGNGDNPGQLNVRISGVPGQVANNSNVQVLVSTGEPNVNVQLQVTYNAAPFFFSATGTSDANGNVVLNWSVRVFGAARRTTARIKAIGFDQQGKQDTSKTISVRIAGGGFGG